MNELEQTISIYHTAFLVFLILTIIFLALSVLLFFLFDIREFLNLRSGRGQRKTIQKMQELNERTGKLRQNPVTATSIELKKAEKPIDSVDNIRENRSSENIEQNTEKIDEAVVAQTDLLQREEETQTELLSTEHNELARTSEQTDDSKEASLPGLFRIEKEIIWIHTEERIERE